MKILVTGGKGFIGSYLTKAMRKKGWQVIDAGHENLDVSMSQDFDVFAQAKVDAVVHLAALLMIDGHRPEDYFKVNAVGTFNALEFCRKNGIKKFVFAMTHSDQNQYPGNIVSENVLCRVFGTGSFEDGKNSIPFIASKVAALEMVEAYRRQGIIPDAVSLRLSNIRGFGSRDTVYNSPFHQFIAKAKAGEDIEIWGNPPKTFRDMIYVKDICSAFIAAIEKDGAGGIYNIGSAVPMTIVDEARAIISVFGDPRKSRLVFNKKIPEVRTKSCRFTIAKAESMLGWKPKYTYVQGLEDFKKEAGW